MADFDFWAKAAEQFRRLQPTAPKPGEVQQHSHNGLGACWNPNGWVGGSTWRLVDASDGVKRLFKIAAENAAVELGHRGGPHSLSDWLDRLRLAGIFCRDAPGGIEIYRVCDASAEYCLKCETDAKLSARKASRISDSQGATRSHLSFWKERQAEFEKYASRYADLTAGWQAAFGTWTLWWEATPQSHPTFPKECASILDAIARIAVTRLDRMSDDGKESWRLWLDFMRERQWGYRVTHLTACTEKEWDAGAKDGRPLADVRREQKYTTGDEWEKVYRRTKNGKLRRLSARELEGKNRESLARYYHWLESGTIEHVFQASADLCEVLASETDLSNFEIAAPEATAYKANGNTFRHRYRRPPGRPQTISDERKAKALNKKKSGGTNKDVAKILYGSRYPDTQQVKNVSSILRNYEKRFGKRDPPES